MVSRYINIGGFVLNHARMLSIVGRNSYLYHKHPYVISIRYSEVKFIFPVYKHDQIYKLKYEDKEHFLEDLNLLKNPPNGFLKEDLTTKGVYFPDLLFGKKKNEE